MTLLCDFGANLCLDSKAGQESIAQLGKATFTLLPKGFGVFRMIAHQSGERRLTGAETGFPVSFESSTNRSSYTE